MQGGILVGSYSQPNQPGIYINDKTIKTVNPSYLLLHPPMLYCVSQTQSGLIKCYQSSGDYHLLNQLSTQGRDPCHISLDHTSRYLFITNYSSGTIAIFLLNPDGTPLKLINFIVHEQKPSGVVSDRQEAPHPHCSLISNDNKVVLIADLGTDYVYWYDFDSQYSNIKGDLKRSVRLEGYGPRHLALGEGELVYMTAELNQRVVVMGMGKGRLEVLAEVVTSQNGGTFLSEVKYFRKVIGGGEFVAVASRGDNEMIIYQIQREGQTIKFNQSTRKKVYNWPRHFNFNASYTKLLVANQRDSKVSQYSYDTQQLTELRTLPITTPSYVEYL